MISPSTPIQLFEVRPRGRDRAAEAGGRRDATAVAVGVLGFCCFMPYPAIPLGNATGIQMGNVLIALMGLPFLTMAWGRRALAIYPLLLAPLAIALLKVALSGDGDLPLCFKSVTVWGASCLAIVVVQLYGPTYALDLLTGIAVAALVHASVGAWQVIAFSSGEFPLPELYVNPSFLSVQENARIIARYTQRPFGLFPEPSAMSSCLAPWVLVWAAECSGLVRLHRTTSGWQRVLFASAAAASLGLIILSRSGHGAVTLGGLLILLAVWFVRAPATPRVYAAVALLSGALLPALLWFASVSLGSRLGGGEMGNSSWEERSASLMLGLNMLLDGDPARALFGMGPGLVSPALWNAARLDAVFSVLLTYVYETGLVGLLAVSWVGYYLVGLWRSARFDLTFLTFGLVWLVGVTLTTSYEQLLPLWIALGWLTVWPELCRGPVARPRAVRARGTPSPLPARGPVPPTREPPTMTAARELRPRPPRWSDSGDLANATDGAFASAGEDAR